MLRYSVTSNDQKPLLLIDLRSNQWGKQGYHNLWRIVNMEEGPPRTTSRKKFTVLNLGFMLEL